MSYNLNLLATQLENYCKAKGFVGLQSATIKKTGVDTFDIVIIPEIVLDTVTVTLSYNENKTIND